MVYHYTTIPGISQKISAGSSYVSYVQLHHCPSHGTLWRSLKASWALRQETMGRPWGDHGGISSHETRGISMKPWKSNPKWGASCRSSHLRAPKWEKPCLVTSMGSPGKCTTRGTENEGIRVRNHEKQWIFPWIFPHVPLVSHDVYNVVPWVKLDLWAL